MRATAFMTVLLIVVSTGCAAAQGRETIEGVTISGVEAGDYLKAGAALKGVTVEGDIYIEELELEAPIEIIESRISGDVSFYRSAMRGGASFRGTHFEGSAEFNGAQIEKEAVFLDTVFEDEASFGETQFRCIAFFENARFMGDAFFNSTVFEHSVNFRKSVFSENGAAYFPNALFRDIVDFKEAAFLSATSFSYSEFRSQSIFDYAAFGGSADFSNTEYVKDVSFTGAVFMGNALFQFTDFAGDAVFTNAEFQKVFDMRMTSFNERLIFMGAGFESISFSGISLNPDLTVMNWNQIAGRIVEYRETETDAGVDVSYVKLSEDVKAQYLYVSNLFKNNGQFSDGDNAYYKYKIVEKQLMDSGWEKFKSRLVDLICGYGTKPWNSIKVGVLVIIGFAFLYFLGDNISDFYEKYALMKDDITTSPGRRLWNSIYFSLNTFTTVGTGDYVPKTTTAMFLSMLEGFIGYIVMALFMITMASQLLR